MEIFKIIDATIISPPRAIIIIVMITVYRGQETGIIVGDVMIFLRPSPPPTPSKPAGTIRSDHVLNQLERDIPRYGGSGLRGVVGRTGRG